MSEFMDAFGDWMVDGVAIVPQAGISVEGQQAAAPIALGPVLLEDKSRMVRTSDGLEVLSARTVYVPEEAPRMPAVGEWLTFPGEAARRRVLTTNHPRHGVLDHMVVACE